MSKNPPPSCGLLARVSNPLPRPGSGKSRAPWNGPNGSRGRRTILSVSETHTVFIVDDDPAVRSALSLLVSSCGWQPRPCASAEEFLRTYSREPSACLLVDLKMPGMSGVELQERLSELEISLPTIVVTAFKDHPLAERALKAGARSIIGKPFHNQDLIDAIEAALNHDA